MSFAADSEAPVVLLSAKKHFDQLPALKNKLYAHHLSKASHWGTRAILRSVSPESENIYDLIIQIHKALGNPTLEEYQTKLASVKVTSYLEYASQFLSNLGNFKSFGDQKFIPRLSAEEFDEVVKVVNNDEVSRLYKLVRTPLYSTDTTLLGWPDKGHVSSYYPSSLTITKDEIEAVNSALAKLGIMPENSRVQKKSDLEFVVHVASSEVTNTTSYYPKDVITTDAGAKVTFQFGDHSPEFKHIVSHLTEAQKYAANETQLAMLKSYVEAFQTGSMNAHKQSQIHWVKDLLPLVESNIGFIETYRDPSGVRGEWEGLVAMVNQERTAKFTRLVNGATDFIALLPWDKVYEGDVFTAPDFTSLEVLTFAGSGCPAGINIPNYDDVRLNIGFKNVSLGNVLSANPKNPKKKEVVTFISEDTAEKYRKWRDDAFEVQVGLHELLGHGTGKLLQEESENKFNFDKAAHPEIKSWYGQHDTWRSLFSSIAGSYEECRAELVALYLILSKPLEILPIFDITSAEDQKDVQFVATLLMVRAGFVGLEFWDPSSNKWGQAHMQARFAIAKVLHSAGVFEVKHTEADYSDLEIVIDESKLSTVAVDALGDFLNKLHVFKSTGNAPEGIAYYTDKTAVTPDYAKFRDAVLAKKLPRKHLIQANTVVKGENVEVVEYDESEVGMIQSFFEREV